MKPVKENLTVFDKKNLTESVKKNLTVCDKSNLTDIPEDIDSEENSLNQTLEGQMGNKKEIYSELQSPSTVYVMRGSYSMEVSLPEASLTIKKTLEENADLLADIGIDLAKYKEAHKKINHLRLNYL